MTHLPLFLVWILFLGCLACAIFLPLFAAGTATSGGIIYNGTAAAGDFWILTNDVAGSTLTVENKTAGTAPVVVPYVKNDDDSYDLVTADGAARTDYVRFVEIPDYVLILETTKAGVAEDQTAAVIGVKSETLTMDMMANPALYYEFRKTVGGGSSGFVTFLQGKNVAPNDPSQWAPTATTLDPTKNIGRVQAGGMNPLPYNSGEGSAFWSYLDANEGNMGINFLPAVETPGPFMIMTEERDGQEDTSTIFGTAFGAFAVDTSNSSIMCFDSTKAKQTASECVGTYTVIYDGKTGASLSGGGDGGEWGGEPTETGTSVTGKAQIVVEDAGGSVTATWKGGAEMSVQTFNAAYGSHYDFAAMTPTPSTTGMFVASAGVRGSSGWTELVFSVLDNSILFHQFTYNGGDLGSSNYDYTFGGGVLDV